MSQSYTQAIKDRSNSLKGMKLGIWSPSDQAAPLFPKRYERALGALKAMGFHVVEGASVHKKMDFGYSNRDLKLIADDLLYLAEQDLNLILCVTGGLTSAGVLPLLDYKALRCVRSTPVVGYSDCTSVLLSLYSRTNLRPFYGPMVISEFGEYGGPFKETLCHFKRCLFESQSEWVISPFVEYTDESLFWDRDDWFRRRKRVLSDPSLVKEYFFREKTMKGFVMAACLPTLLTLVGSRYLPKFKDSILFLEDHSLSLKELYSRLHQLSHTGIIEGIKGIVFSKFANSEELKGAKFDRVISEFCEYTKIPLITGFDFGHTEPMTTLAFGDLAKVEMSDKPSITITRCKR